ncbi:MAG: hypothetical protein ACREQB_06315, partial [Candidatus Binataceae bacterium]
MLGGFLLILGGCAIPNAARYDDAQFRARITAIKSVAIVTPQVQLVRKGIGSSERLYAEDQRVADELRGAVAATLSQRGFATSSVQLSDDVRTQLRSAYDVIDYEQLNAERHSTLSGRYDLGPEVAAVAERAGADGIVFVVFEGVTRSGASVAAEYVFKILLGAGTGVVLPKDSNGAAILIVTFVDGRSGDVLWEDRVGEIWTALIPDFDRDELDGMV